jgi:MFS family permease
MDVATQAPDPGPTRPVSNWFMLAYALTYLAVYIALFTPLLATIAVKIGQIAPPADTAKNLGIVLAPGAFAALLAAPIFGAISDRTQYGFGKRKTWIVAGAAITFLGLLMMALGTSLTMLAIGWFAVQVGSNASLAAGNALLPEHVPEHQRGRVSALLGIALSLSFLAGSYISQFTTGSNVLMFLVPWALVPIAIALVLSCFKDGPVGQLPPFKAIDLARTFWVNPVKHPDFAWAFLSRFLVFMGVAYYLSYQFLFIGGQLKLSQVEALNALFLSQLVSTVVTVICTLISGWLSDRMGRRKPVVFVAGIFVAIGLLIIATSTDLNQFLIGAAVYGVGQGIYFAVDMALVAAVLPNPDATGKDLGVFNIASTFPQTVAPVIAPIFLAIGSVAGGNLPAVFIAGAVFAVIGSFAVMPIRGTR